MDNIVAFGSVTQIAHAQAIGTYLTLAPGSGRQRLSPALTANFAVRAEGNSDNGVRFIVFRNSVKVYQSPTDTTVAFAYQINSNQYPTMFPGTYQVCANNLSTQTAHVFLGLATDNDVKP